MADIGETPSSSSDANIPDDGSGTIDPIDKPTSREQPEVAARALNKLSSASGFQEITTMMGAMGPMGHPLHQKMNEEHITKMLDLAVQHDTNEFQLRKDQLKIDSKNEHEHRIAHLLYFVVFVGLIILILVLFRDQPTVLVPILTGVGGFVGGLMGGIGYAKSGFARNKREKE